MLQALFEFFYSLFSLQMPTGDGLNSIHVNLDCGNGEIYSFGDGMQEYFALICSLISLIFIVVLCCLFVYKIIRLIGGLIR